MEKEKIIKYSLIGVAAVIVAVVIFIIGGTYGSIKTELSMPFVEETYVLNEGRYYVGSDKLPAGSYRLTTPNKDEIAYFYCWREKGESFGELIYDKDYVYYDMNGQLGDGTFKIALSKGDEIIIKDNSIVFSTYDKLASWRK